MDDEVARLSRNLQADPNDEMSGQRLKMLQERMKGRGMLCANILDNIMSNHSAFVGTNTVESEPGFIYVIHGWLFCNNENNTQKVALCEINHEGLNSDITPAFSLGPHEKWHIMFDDQCTYKTTRPGSPLRFRREDYRGEGVTGTVWYSKQRKTEG